MPGYETIDKAEFEEIKNIFFFFFVLFRNGFDNLRNGVYKVKDFEKKFADHMGAKYALAVTSGTAAIRVALSVLDLKPNDEIITQSFTFVATVEAIIESRARPICAEIDDTFNLDPIDLEKRINKNTKAVIVVHMLGTPARLKEIKKICNKHKLILIEDTAWGCGGMLNGKHLGTWGEMGTYSFDFAKMMTTGEGGMVLFKNKNDYLKASAWHDHGHENNPTLPRWEDSRTKSGFNYRMTELQAAVGIAQLKKLNYIIKKHQTNKVLIMNSIIDLPGIKIRNLPEGSFDTSDALVFSVKDKYTAKLCRTELLKYDISTKILPEAYTWHFAGTWTHMPELVNSHDNLADEFPFSKNILQSAVSIPINVNMLSSLPANVREALKKVLL